MGGDLGQAKELAFYPPPTESTKAVGQNVTGFPVEEEKAGFSGGQMAMAESRGRRGTRLLQSPGPAMLANLPGQARRGGGEGSASTPLQPSVPSHRDCASSHS